MYSSFAKISKTLVAGAITPVSGRYRVHHSVGHRPDAEVVLSRGVQLPTCNVAGCQVTFELVVIKWGISDPDDNEEEDLNSSHLSG